MASRRKWIILVALFNIFVLYLIYTLLQEKTILVYDQISSATKPAAETSNMERFREHSDNSSVNLQTNHNMNKENSKVNTVKNITLQDMSDIDSLDAYKTEMLMAEVHREELLQRLWQAHADHCHTTCDYRNVNKTQQNYTFFRNSFQVDQSLFASLKQPYKPPQALCGNKLIIHYHSFALLKDVVLRPYKRQLTGLSEAGKELYKFKDLRLTTDEGEKLKPTSGLFDLYCPGRDLVTIDNKSLEDTLMLKYLTHHKQLTSHDKKLVGKLAGAYIHKTHFTIAIEREDYANMYHVMLHIYNIFAMLLQFHQQPVNVSILILDLHPQAEVDTILETLYGPIFRVTKLMNHVKYDNLVLSLKENKSSLSKYSMESLPYLEEFRTFMITKHLVDDKHVLDCRKLTLTFIWRRDKVWHPRNLIGMTYRKIFNEREIFNSVYEKYPNICVNGLLLETLPMREQLKYISKTDILIGMHGAGLTHALFLPKTAGIIELFPLNFKKQVHYHKLFHAITVWRKLHYLSWENTDEESELRNYYTRVDPKALVKLVDNMIRRICIDQPFFNH